MSGLVGLRILNIFNLILIFSCHIPSKSQAMKDGYTEYVPPSYPTNLIQKDWSQRKLNISVKDLQFHRKVYDVEVFDDDVWLVTVPKAGTTWMQELLWLVMNDFDFASAKEEHLELRSPFMEFDYYIHNNLTTAFKRIEELKRPRLIKTHLSLPFLPHQLWDKKPKVVYVVRNLKDAIVSGYYHVRAVGMISNDTTLDSFVKYEIEDGFEGEDPFPHMMEFYTLRNESWIFYTSFEKMKMNLRQVITDVCKFLNKTIDETTMEKMLKHLSFEEMKKNPKTNHLWEFQQTQKTNMPEFNFVRKGQVNSYREELSEEMVRKLDHWVDDNLKIYNVTLDDLLLLNIEDKN